jgi:y4mF family transcriptional regulator
MSNPVSNFIRYRREQTGMTQEELARKAGVGLRFIRELEQGKESLRMDKVKQVLQLFGYTVAQASDKIMDPYEIHRYHYNRSVVIQLKNKKKLYGIIIDQVRKGNEITGWKFISNNNAIAFQKTKNPKLIQFIAHADIDSIENIK